MKRTAADPTLGVLLGLSAAVTFGAGTPAAKRLLDEQAGPQLLAGLLYAGAAVALGVAWCLRRSTAEAPLRRADLPRLAGLSVAGSVVAPVLLLVGLERISGLAGSLLLNLEGPATLALALVLFGEHLSRRAGLGAVTIFVGAAVITVGGSGGDVDVVGALCVVGACIAWGIDNNLTQTLTTRDPLALVLVKATIGATVNLTVATLRAERWPDGGRWLVAALALGATSYGLSVLLDAFALRRLGAAREAAIFATAPFAGALLALPILGDTPRLRDVVAAGLMAVGVALTLSERHEHEHVHAALRHDHVHRHDDHHHDHDHPPGISEPHAHEHVHGPVAHRHRHVSDVHHRHPH